MPQQRLDDRLATDIQLPGFLIKLLKHWKSEVYVHSLNRRHHLSFSGEKA
jgi:hypothetical protein